MKSFLRICFVFTALALSLLMFSTGIASANMTHKQVKGIIYKTGCSMMKKTGMMNGEKRYMEMNKKM